MNMDTLTKSAKDAFDMRTAPSLTVLMKTFAELEGAKDEARFAHALRYGSMLNGLEFLTNVTKKLFPIVPSFIIMIVHDKAQSYIITKLDDYEVEKNVQ